MAEQDTTLPPFSSMDLPTTITLLVYLDKDKPLSEPKWVKSGDIQEWMKSMFGRMFWVAGDAADGWEKKIQVMDPDPVRSSLDRSISMYSLLPPQPPTIWTVLDGWATNSPAGAPMERQRFLKTHMTEMENVLEILLRLVRGERATAHQSTPTISTANLSGPLLAAMQSSEHGLQQTHVSLAVLAMYQMALDYAQKALNTEEGKKEAEERVGEIVRSLPSHLIYKSLDGIFKEWKVEKKGR
jgi:20S proteasome subunit alpha 6